MKIVQKIVDHDSSSVHQSAVSTVDSMRDTEIWRGQVWRFVRRLIDHAEDVDPDVGGHRDKGDPHPGLNEIVL